MKEAFEKMTGMPDAWTNPALMVSRNAFIQGWEAAQTGHDVDATIIQYHEATIKRLEKRIEELAQPAQQERVQTDSLADIGAAYKDIHACLTETLQLSRKQNGHSRQPAQEPITVLTSAGYISDDDDIQVYQRPWAGLTEAQFLEATRLAENGNYLVAFVRIQEWLKEQNT